MSTFPDGIGYRPSTPQNHINLDNKYFKSKGMAGNVRSWQSSDGGIVTLHFFDRPPELPQGQKTVESFARLFHSSVGPGLVQMQLDTIRDIRVVKSIRKFPQATNGFTYTGNIIFPFLNCSYVFEVTYEESGTTGMREAVLLEKAIARGDITINDKGDFLGKFDPDNEAHDSNFSDHPVSQCRKALELIEWSVQVPAKTKQLDPFDLPKLD